MATIKENTMATIKVPIMTLKIDVAGQTKTFTSPLAETILNQIGEGQVKFFDVSDKKSKFFTSCCGDKYEISYSTEEITLAETEKDFCGFPITYEGDK